MKYYIFQFEFYKYLWFVNGKISLKYCIIVLLYGKSLLCVGDYLKTASYFCHQTLQVKLKIWLILLIFLNACILQLVLQCNSRTTQHCSAQEVEERWWTAAQGRHAHKEVWLGWGSGCDHFITALGILGFYNFYQ